MLQKYGAKVIVVPEVARELIAAGFHPLNDKWKESGLIEIFPFQIQVFLAILEKEAGYLRAIQELDLKGQQVVMLCDRGLLDGAAYSGMPYFKNMIRGYELKMADVLDRYHGVVHLVSAADGAPEHYVKDDERTEDIADAVALDHRLVEVWSQHQHHSIVDNSTDFPTKINRALLALNRILHMNQPPQEIEKKFRIWGPIPAWILKSPHYLIEQIYLAQPDRPGIECRVRRKTTEGTHSYFYTEKTPTEIEGVRGEFEEEVPMERYRELIATYADPACRPISKIRYKVRHGSHILEFDIFTGHLEGLRLLEVEFKTAEEMRDFSPPMWLEVTDCSGDNRFSNRQLAEHGIPVQLADD